MSKPSRLSPLPMTPALVRRTASIAAVATAVGVVGCGGNQPPQAYEAPQIDHGPPPPQAPPQVEEAPQVDTAPQVQKAPQVPRNER